MKDLKPAEIAEKLKHLSKIDAFKNTRKKDIIEIRALLIYLLREKLNMRWTYISNFFNQNGKTMTHATAMHSYKMYPIHKRYNKKLEEYERLFTFKSDLTYDEIDRIHYLENKIKNLEYKLEEEYKHPLINLLKTIPEKKYDETYERIRAVVRSWEWKHKEDKVTN